MDVTENSTIKSKILVGVIHQLKMGGAERMMVNILNHFAKEGEEVHLIIFKNIGSLKELLDSTIVIHDLDASSVKQSIPKCLLELYRLKPDTVFSGIGHVNIALSSFIPMMRMVLPNTRWVSRETNIVSMENKKSKYPKLIEWLYRNVYKNYDVIVAQSEDMRDDLALNYTSAASKAIVINNPIDIDKVESLSNEFEFKKINLVNIGILRKTKRHDLMLRTLAKLPSNYTLYLIGDGPEEERLKALVKELDIADRVTFEGHKTNPYPYMKKADLFLLTSAHEGFPNVLLEANALGLPVIAFACPGGITEIVQEGRNGFSVTNGDINEMVATIKKASKYEFNKEEIVKATRERYAHDVILEKYRKIFYE
jgi:glycosyltransferase involved in cell wall biosynthesis